ncbi:13313_t:CDS:2 [Funneliformis caledonium]|uniref:13313_t:CDS:1 n=1 Tax=Funneliformis caledonium TaxID=1117310 RepID=A0A9N8WFU3_9GLOM|nr:13313_t:CDS:2 [Funneliformis caledonium]
MFILSLSETVSITPREQELLDQLAELQKNLVSIYEFYVVINPKRKGFKSVLGFEHIFFDFKYFGQGFGHRKIADDLCSLKETIFAIYKTQELEEKKQLCPSHFRLSKNVPALWAW